MIKYLSFLIISLELFAADPIIKHIYTADPSANVFDGKLYLYPSHDPDKLEGFFPMVDYHVFSSSDLKKWKDHGSVLHKDQVAWVKDRMWAPDVALFSAHQEGFVPSVSRKS